MKFQVISSGSKGNITYVELDNKKFLVDLGLSFKTINELAENNEIELDRLDGVFFTHEHSDHVKGIQTFRNKLPKIPLLMTKGTFKGLKDSVQDKLRVQGIQEIKANTKVCISEETSLDIFQLSHDAIDPVGFVFNELNKKLVLLTDTGYVSEEIQERLSGADAYVIEFNHDPELLLHSRYPWHIKQRILSHKGHLSNEDAAIFLAKAAKENLKHVILAHMSEQNNLTELAFSNIQSYVNTHKAKVQRAFQERSLEKLEI